MGSSKAGNWTLAQQVRLIQKFCKFPCSDRLDSSSFEPLLVDIIQRYFLFWVAKVAFSL
jgi:hypothetical protein